MDHPIKALAAVALVGALVLSGCSRGETTAAGGEGASSGPVPTDSCPADAMTPLAEGEPIKLGVSLAQSGPIAVVNNIAKAINAVFEKQNAEGGIDGHKIEFVVKDDAFETARAVTNVRQLIDSTKVMAMVGQVGTPGVAATQPFVERSCTPQLWVASGVSSLTADPEKHPFTTSNLAPYETEAALWVKALQDQGLTTGNIAMINADDDRSEVFADAVTESIEGTDLKLVSVEQVAAAAPSVDAQVNATLATKPDAVLIGTSTSNCPPLMTGLRRAGFTGTIIVNVTCSAIKTNFVTAGEAAQGVEVLTTTTDPANPASADDPQLAEYHEVMKQYAADADANNGYTAGGYQIGLLTVETLKKAAKLDGGLSRVNIMNAAWTIDAEIPLSPKGVRATLNWTKDPLWREEAQLMKYDTTKGLLPVGGVIAGG